MASEPEVPDEIKNPPEGDEDSDYEEKDDSEDEREDSEYGDNKDDTDFEDMVIPNEDIEVKSLEKLCLKSVTKNFDRFNTAYKTTEDPNLRRNLQFLQRAYSQHMIKEMQGSIRDHNLDFLLNEHLKELNVDVISKCSEEAIVRRIREIGHSIVKGNMNPIPNATWGIFGELRLVKSIVECLPNVLVLYVRNICTNDILESIASTCLKLEELYLEESDDVNNGGMENLFEETEDDDLRPAIPLKVLSLTNTHVKQDGVAVVLRKMPSLQVLNDRVVPLVIHAMYVTDLENDSLHMYNLTTLDFMKFKHVLKTINLSSQLSSCAVVCPHVTKLRTPILIPKHLDLISLYLVLEDLTLNYVGKRKIPLRVDEFLKSNGGKLKKLNLGRFVVTIPILLQSCPRLEDLTLRCVRFRWSDAEVTGDLPTLVHMQNLFFKSFLFVDDPINEKSVEALLNSCPHLKSLVISHTGLADSNIHTKIMNFCAKSSIETLHFRYSDVDGLSVERILSTSSSLRTLLIRDCNRIDLDHMEDFRRILYTKRQKVDIIFGNPSSDNGSSSRSELNSLTEEAFEGYEISDDSDELGKSSHEFDPKRYRFEETSSDDRRSNSEESSSDDSRSNSEDSSRAET